MKGRQLCKYGDRVDVRHGTNKKRIETFIVRTLHQKDFEVYSSYVKITVIYSVHEYPSSCFICLAPSNRFDFFFGKLFGELTFLTSWSIKYHNSFQSFSVTHFLFLSLSIIYDRKWCRRTQDHMNNWWLWWCFSFFSFSLIAWKQR